MYNPLELRDDLKRKPAEDDRDPFGRIRPEPKPEPEISNLGDASKLDRPVGEKGKNDRRDVAKVETMLGRTGALDLKKTEGPTGYWGERTREATRAFQKQHGLKVDGQINPGGETIRTLAKVAGGVIKALAGNSQKAQPEPRHSDAPMRHPDILTRHPGAGRGPERSDSLDSGLGRHDDKRSDHPPYALPDDVFAENQRMARALAKRRGIGDFDRFTTDAINTDGAKAVYEVGDLIKQVRRTDPAQADELLAKTRKGIAPANVRLLARLAAADNTDARQVAEPARRDAPAQQTPESQDARTPSAPKDKPEPSEGPSGISMDEHGQYYDEKGKPIPNPDENPDIRKAQLAPPLPGAAPVPGGVTPVSPKDIDKALKNAGDDLGKLARDPAFLKTPLGKAMIMQGMFKGVLDSDGASPRTDVAPKLPDREEFPAHEGDPRNDVIVSPDDAMLDDAVPPSMPQSVNQDTPPSEDQSDDPDFAGLQISEIEKLPKPVDHAKGDALPDVVEEQYAHLPDDVKQQIREDAHSIGVMDEASDEASNTRTDMSEQELSDHYESLVRKRGDGTLNGIEIDSKNGTRTFKAPNGVRYVHYKDSKHGMAIQVQTKRANGKLYKNKIRSRNTSESR